MKTFVVGIFPYDSPLLPQDPLGEAALDLRLRITGRLGSHLKYVVHPILTTTSLSADLTALPGASLGAGGGTPEAVKLSWAATTNRALAVNLRFDRLYVAASTPGLTLTVGRQPISFGTTFFFNPEDLVAPFTPTTIDREYKPGVDAVRGDFYFGTSGQLTAVATYAGGWDEAGTVFAVRSGFTLGVFDVGLFTALVHGDAVVGLDTAGSLGAFGVRGEATLTYPADGGSPFVRAVIGADRQWGSLRLSAEAYLQTLGATSPAGYLALALSPRVQRGEVWALGRTYAAASADYEVTPIVHVSAFVVANLGDPSALAGLGCAWSVGDNAEVDGGLYYGGGRRPEQLTVRSEFGLTPTTAYLEMKSYF